MMHVALRLNLLGVLLLLSACSVISVQPTSYDNRETPLILAHGASSDGLPYNSLSALTHTLKNPAYDGIELDVVLTADSVPVVAHDPWLSPEICRRFDRQPFEKIMISETLFDELTADYECRHLPEFASDKKHTILPDGGYHALPSLHEALATLSDRSVVYLDLKIQSEITLPASEYGAEIVNLLLELSLSNPLFIEAPEVDDMRAIKSEFAQAYSGESPRALPIHWVLSYPAFYAGENWNRVRANAAIKTQFHRARPRELAQHASADVVMSPMSVMSTAAIEELHEHQIGFGTFLIGDQKSLQRACDHGAAVMIVDIEPPANHVCTQ